MNSLRQLAKLILSTLREIFDENAYTRYLAREAKVSSPAAYADFVREQESAPAPRPRCC